MKQLEIREFRFLFFCRANNEKICPADCQAIKYEDAIIISVKMGEKTHIRNRFSLIS